MSEDKVMIRYWRQDTIESGHWEETALVPRNIAEKMLDYHVLERGEIVTPEHVTTPTKMIGNRAYPVEIEE